MKVFRTALAIAVLGLSGGCVTAPSYPEYVAAPAPYYGPAYYPPPGPGYYGPAYPPPAYYGPAYYPRYYGPAVGIGIYGGWRGGPRRGGHQRRR